MIWSHNDQWMLTGDHGGFVKYWQSNMNNVKMYQAHKDPVRGLRWELRHSRRTFARHFVVDSTTYDGGEALNITCNGLNLVWLERWLASHPRLLPRCTVCSQLKLLKVNDILLKFIHFCYLWLLTCTCFYVLLAARTDFLMVCNAVIHAFDGLHLCQINLIILFTYK